MALPHVEGILVRELLVSRPVEARLQRAAGYTWGGKTLHNAAYTSPTWAFSEGGLVSSVTDLAKAEAGLFGEKLLKRETVERMWQPSRPPAEPRSIGYLGGRAGGLAGQGSGGRLRRARSRLSRAGAQVIEQLTSPRRRVRSAG